MLSVFQVILKHSNIWLMFMLMDVSWFLTVLLEIKVMTSSVNMWLDTLFLIIFFRVEYSNLSVSGFRGHLKKFFSLLNLCYLMSQIKVSSAQQRKRMQCHVKSIVPSTEACVTLSLPPLCKEDSQYTCTIWNWTFGYHCSVRTL